jgi:tetraacyldisaccharide 4'-kinase
MYPPSWLRPASALFGRIVALRRAVYRHGVKKTERLPVPVIVVGNLTVGGTGKTPLVIWLAEFLSRSGYRPGIVSRGYGGARHERPSVVQPQSEPKWVGDEPVLLARRTGRPVCVHANRAWAGRTLLATEDCDVLIADDGLQHYALARDIEIAVVDGERRFGNGALLPAGPLREPVERLGEVDFIVTRNRPEIGEYEMLLAGDEAVRLNDPSQRKPLAALGATPVHAVAGIGNPGRFFDFLRQAGLTVVTHAFPDHHAFAPADLRFDDDFPVLMTEKDAVKCRAFADARHWYLPVTARLPPAFGENLLNLLKAKHDGRKTA